MALANIQLNASASATNTKTFGLASASRTVNESSSFSWSEGTGANQADLLYDAELTIGASANQDLDLDGVLTDAFGDALTYVKVKAIYIKADATNVNNVQVTRPASNGVPIFLASGDGVSLPPGAALSLVAPGAAGLASVTAGTADLINLANSGAGSSVKARVVILGTSA